MLHSYFYRCWSIASCLIVSFALTLQADDRPNILVIVADDLGYADLGFQGCRDIPTPHLDGLAKQSIHCTSGYVSHPFCSPTRAGLLTGRYQQRFGHENNPAWLPENTTAGLPLSETTLPMVLKEAGYMTGCVGKWHLGAHPSFHPNRRGFDHYYGALGGGHVYLDGLRGGPEYLIPMDRNGQPEPLQAYITTVFGREASNFIKQPRSTPWFLYLAFNAPHTPLQSTAELQERVKHIEDQERKDLAALIVGLDDAVGDVLSSLDASGQREKTLVFFFSDNGGPITVSKCSNAPLRAGKGSLYEGGMRVPFLVSWPTRLPGNVQYADPVISLDVFATAVSLAEASVPSQHRLEGVNLIPHLTGAKKGLAHERLFWRTGGGSSYAVREGNWKLVGTRDGQPELYDLGKDIGETTNLAEQEPQVLLRMLNAYREWDSKNIAPIFESPNGGRRAGRKE